MSSHLPNAFTSRFLKIFDLLEVFILVVITLATAAAMIEECMVIYVNKRIQLTDILLMFIYLEILSMVQQFIANGRIPVRYPIYIAIMAIARYITLGMKELDGVFVVWLALAAFILAAATLLIRIGHHYWPYPHDTEPDKKPTHKTSTLPEKSQTP